MKTLRFFCLALIIALTCIAPGAAQQTRKKLPTYHAKVMPTKDPGFFLGCSLECAMGWTMSASSHLTSTGKSNYFADNASDGNLKTCWADGVPGDGMGQWLGFNLKDHPGRKGTATTLWGFHFSNGYVKTLHLWQANNRVRTFRLEVNRKPVCYLKLVNSPKDQSVNFPVVEVKAGDQIRLVITDVYLGSRYADTCITEARPMGAH